MDKKILHEKIYYYENVIPNFEHFMKTLEEANIDWDEWSSSNDKTYIYGDSKQFDSYRINELEDQALKEIFLYIFNTIKDAQYEVFKDYAESLGDYEKPRLFPAFNIKKYNTGASMGSHFDQLDGDNSLRYSLVMYLNDDFKGGEISFKMVDYKNNIIEKPWIEIDYDEALELKQFDVGIKPKANSAIVFPSSSPYFHTAHLVKTGFKYMVTGHWIHNDMSFNGGEQPELEFKGKE